MHQEATGTSQDTNLSQQLRGLGVFNVDLPAFDPDQAPDNPVELFVEWLRAAIDDQVPEPHAVALATVDAQNRPSNRVLILRDVDEDGRWYFASSANSSKGRDLAANPNAALTFYWPKHGRQIRIRGVAESAGRERSAADFLGRSPGARAETLLGRQSQPLADPAEIDGLIGESEARLARDPNLIAEHWTLYALTARDIEFWQADKERRHTRLRYDRDGDNDGGGEGQKWVRDRLWP